MRSVLRVKRFILYIADEAVLGEADWCIMWITRVVPDAKTMLSVPHLPECSGALAQRLRSPTTC